MLRFRITDDDSRRVYYGGDGDRLYCFQREAAGFAFYRCDNQGVPLGLASGIDKPLDRLPTDGSPTRRCGRWRAVGGGIAAFQFAGHAETAAVA